MQIGAIDARGRDLDQNLACAGHGLGNVSKLKPVIGAGIFEDDGFHENLVRNAARDQTSG